jgi:hypothetical protein
MQGRVADKLPRSWPADAALPAALAQSAGVLPGRHTLNALPCAANATMCSASAMGDTHDTTDPDLPAGSVISKAPQVTAFSTMDSSEVAADALAGPGVYTFWLGADDAQEAGDALKSAPSVELRGCAPGWAPAVQAGQGHGPEGDVVTWWQDGQEIRAQCVQAVLCALDMPTLVRPVGQDGAVRPLSCVACLCLRQAWRRTFGHVSALARQAKTLLALALQKTSDSCMWYRICSSQAVLLIRAKHEPAATRRLDS